MKLDRYRLYGVPEYWVVDPYERRVEVWDLAARETEPASYGIADALKWTPTAGGPTLELRIREILGD